MTFAKSHVYGGAHESLQRGKSERLGRKGSRSDATRQSVPANIGFSVTKTVVQCLGKYEAQKQP